MTYSKKTVVLLWSSEQQQGLSCVCHPGGSGDRGWPIVHQRLMT